MAETPGTQSLGVVWQEGMLLSPQHFQQADRAAHQRLAQRFRFSERFGWGVRALEIEESALQHGRLALTRAEGVFPDGTAFDTGQGDPLPAPRDIAPWFEGQRDTLLVHLGLPLPQRGKPLAAAEAGTAVPGPRHLVRAETVPDENAEGSDREIALARRNLVLLLPDEALSQYERLPLAEIVRTTSGFVLRDAFDGVADPLLPPVIALQGSRGLLAKVRRVHNLLLDRSRELSEMRTQRGGSAEFGRADLGNFWMLHCVNAHIPLLQHFTDHPEVHPEEVFLALASLAGMLCTLSSEHTPRDLPVYEHEALGSCFGQLCRLLEEMLREPAVRRGVRLPLERKPGSIQVAKVTQAELLGPGGRLFLGVSIEGPERQQALLTFPDRTKIASEAKVRQLVISAAKGLGLHEPRPVPSGTPCYNGFDYFELDRTHALWKDVEDAREVAVYLARALEHVKLDLVGTWE